MHDRRALITPRSATALTGMARIAPVEDLRDIVEQHWVVAWDYRGHPPVVREVLSDPCVNLAVEPSGVLVYGVTSAPSAHALEGRGIVVGTKFRAGGFSGFLPGAVRELNDRVLPVADAFGEAGVRLTRELEAARTTEDMIVLVTGFIRARRPLPDTQRTLVGEIVEAMRAAPPGTRVAEVASRFALAPRTLQRLFADHVGATPKQVLQRFRHQRATDELSEAPAGLARLAAELGYFDQSHFVQDFRAATGRLPSAVAAGA
jgi:AraC-like DNA-binding protein